MDSVPFPPTIDYDHPLDAIESCHGRIRRQLALLRKLAAHVRFKRTDAEARDVAAFLLGFFETTASNHHDDEEEDLFPAIEHFAPSQELNAARALIFQLRGDHKKFQGRWSDMLPRLAAMAGGREGGLTEELAARFDEGYGQHMDVEERDMLPLARRVLPPDAIARLGKSMSRRRDPSQKAA